MNRHYVEITATNTDRTEKPHVERFSFSGHETFALRVAWLPKAVVAISQGKYRFSNPREGMRILGLGKNMVTALQCWGDCFGVTHHRDGRWKVTEFGEIIFSTHGKDPFLVSLEHSFNTIPHTQRKFDSLDVRLGSSPTPSPVVQRQDGFRGSTASASYQAKA